jgi:hypothetical protein
MFGGPIGPDAAFGAPDGEVACGGGWFAVADVLGDRGIFWALRWCGRRGLGVRRGDASTVTGGSVAEFVEETGIATGDSGIAAGAGLAASGSDCADASAGINPDISASPRHRFDTPQPPYRQEAKHQAWNPRWSWSDSQPRCKHFAHRTLIGRWSRIPSMMSMTIHHTWYDERPKNAAHHHYARRRPDG